jgi:hypothetical protein
MEIECCTSGDVPRAIASIGRTEDVRFSPRNTRLAVAAARRDRIVVFDVEITATGASPGVRLTGAVEISSPCLRYPHGLEFIDEATLIVGSRHGEIAVFDLLPAGNAVRECVVEPRRTLAAGPDSSVRWPGSLAIVRSNPQACELLVCNNFRHAITRHLLAPGAQDAAAEIILGKWLDVPDGIAVSGDGRWIAVSNHFTHNVLIYENTPALAPDADPDGILRSMHHPHGIRFSADGRYVFVADAGAPYVHVYRSDDACWRGVRSPMISFKVMDDAAFLRGHVNVHEGGPKGVDLDNDARVLVVTSEHQPLAFFDLAAVLRAEPVRAPSLEMQVELGAMESATGHRRQLLELRRRVAENAAKARTVLEKAERKALRAEAWAARQAKRAARFKAKAEKAKAKAARAKARNGFVIMGRRWPITAPLRLLYAAIKRPD